MVAVIYVRSEIIYNNLYELKLFLKLNCHFELKKLEKYSDVSVTYQSAFSKTELKQNYKGNSQNNSKAPSI